MHNCCQELMGLVSHIKFSPKLLAGKNEINESERKATFTMPYSLYQLKVMAFRLKNVPATFQRFMKIALAELKCLICLNVIIIFGRTPEQHLYVTVGTYLKKQLMLLPTKCKLYVEYGRHELVSLN
ncbi:Enzymatic polyprotein [Trichinella pseudospiralis]|uniref:Enzymatic polyprotein n=1 Tax=Trichinella pseudospiralis TaxID=6337 RepID=A0A0V1FPN3_TRIPS|nr:Enzymatic polyprotein [Trichinella pseudospiralis]